MISAVIMVIRILSEGIFLLVIADVILSYFMSPFHPVRETISKFVNPLLSPIRKIVPPVGTIDFSPLVLIILVQVIETLLITILSSMG